MVAIRLPKYRHHKAKGLAVVTIDGRHANGPHTLYRDDGPLG
jgi:hypothetical protein